MGEACSKPEKDTKHEVDRNSQLYNDSQAYQQRMRDSDARFYEEPVVNFKEDRKNKIFESRYVEKPVVANKTGVIPEETVNSYHQFEGKSTYLERNKGNLLGVPEHNERGRDLKRSSNNSMVSTNQSAIKRSNFYDDDFQYERVLGSHRSFSNQRFDDKAVNVGRQNKIFANEASPVKPVPKEKAAKNGGMKGKKEKEATSNIFMADMKIEGFKSDVNGASYRQPDKQFASQVAEKKKVNKVTFKDFIEENEQEDKLKKGKAGRLNTPGSGKQETRTLDWSDNKSNVKVTVKRDVVYEDKQNTQNAGSNYDRLSYRSNGIEAYNHNQRAEPMMQYGQSAPNNNLPHSMNDYQNPNGMRQSLPRDSMPVSNSPNKMKLTGYKDSYGFNGIRESQVDNLPSVTDHKGIRESNVHSLPDFQPDRHDNGNPLGTIKEEDRQPDGEHAPVRLANGSTYVGDMKDNVPHGKGREILTNGDVYTGEFVEGRRHGEGRYEKWNTYIYTGGFRNNRFEGKGKKAFPNGETFEGLFKNGKEEGTGILRDANGNTLQHGMWIDGEYTKL